jgi:hypothetical protein
MIGDRESGSGRLLLYTLSAYPHVMFKFPG